MLLSGEVLWDAPVGREPPRHSRISSGIGSTPHTLMANVMILPFVMASYGSISAKLCLRICTIVLVPLALGPSASAKVVFAVTAKFITAAQAMMPS